MAEPNHTQTDSQGSQDQTIDPNSTQPDPQGSQYQIINPNASHNFFLPPVPNHAPRLQVHYQVTHHPNAVACMDNQGTYCYWNPNYPFPLPGVQEMPFPDLSNTTFQAATISIANACLFYMERELARSASSDRVANIVLDGLFVLHLPSSRRRTHSFRPIGSLQQLETVMGGLRGDAAYRANRTLHAVFHCVGYVNSN